MKPMNIFHCSGTVQRLFSVYCRFKACVVFSTPKDFPNHLYDFSSLSVKIFHSEMTLLHCSVLQSLWDWGMVSGSRWFLFFPPLHMISIMWHLQVCEPLSELLLLKKKPYSFKPLNAVSNSFTKEAAKETVLRGRFLMWRQLDKTYTV